MKKMKFNIQCFSNINLGTNAADSINNTLDNAIIDALAGDDTIINSGRYVSINANAGNDKITNNGAERITVYSGDGNDYIHNYGAKNAVLNGGDGNDSIRNDYPRGSENYSDNSTLIGGSGNDSIYNNSHTVKVYAGDGEDYIYNSYGHYSTIDAGNGNDYVWNDGQYVNIHTGDGADSVYSSSSIYSTINGGNGDDHFSIEFSHYSSIFGGAGNDTIEVINNIFNVHSENLNVTINGGEGNDKIYSNGNTVTIIGDTGDDYISLSSSSNNNHIKYSNGDGNDIIYGVSSDDTLQVTGAKYTTLKSGGDLIVSVGSGKITVAGAANVSFTIEGTLDSEGTLPSGWKYGNTAKTKLTASVSSGANVDLNQTYGTSVATVDGSKISSARTFNGNGKANSIKGGTGNDVINGNAGADTLYGGNGNDKIYGGNDSDKLYGEAGNDSLYGGSGNDTLTGGAGNDTFYYETGNDVITDYVAGTDKIKLVNSTITSSSLNGSDVVLKTSNGNITVQKAKDKKITVIDKSGKETTQVYATVKVDPTPTLPSGWKYGNTAKTNVTASIASAANVDLTQSYGTSVVTVDGSKISSAITFTGNAKANSIKGGTGNDVIYGNAGADILYGGSGNDKIYGGNDNDKLYGDAGKDSLYGNSGNDTLTGGAGNDTFYYETGNDVITDYVAGTDKIKLVSSTITSSSLSGTDVVLKTTNGFITVQNAKGKKITVIDKSGKETTQVYATVKVDSTPTLPSGWKYGNTAKTNVTASVASAANVDLTQSYGTSVVTVDGSKISSAITFTGNAKANSIKGGTGNDVIYGNAGADILYGGSGNDKIYGGNDNDKLYGDAGNDSLYGGSGNDTLTGGAGNDVFVYEDGNYTISDYTVGQDVIYLSDGIILDVSCNNEDIIFNVGMGSITVKNAKGKNITIIDLFGNKTTKNYSTSQIPSIKPTEEEMVESVHITAKKGLESFVNAFNNIDFQSWANSSKDETEKILVQDMQTIVNLSRSLLVNENSVNLNTFSSDKTRILAKSSSNLTIQSNGILDSFKENIEKITKVVGHVQDITDVINDYITFMPKSKQILLRTLLSGVNFATSYISTGNEYKDKAARGSEIINWVGTILGYVVKGSKANIAVNAATSIVVGGYNAIMDYKELSADGKIDLSDVGHIAATFFTEGISNFVSSIPVVGLLTDFFVFTDDNKELVKSAVSDALIFDENVRLTDTHSALFKPKSYVKNIDASERKKDIEIFGNNNDNAINGGSGDDTIHGNGGNDKLKGGSGKDVFVYASGDGIDTILDYVSREDKIKIESGTISGYSVDGKDAILKVGQGKIILKNVENSKIEVITSDNKTMTYGGTTIKGLKFNSTDTSKATAVTIDSNYNENFESVRYPNLEVITASSCTNTIEIVGNAKGNKIYGGSVSDILSGGDGKDILYGGSGNDLIYGEKDVDNLFGESGDDTLFGGLDNDNLTGGSGKDVFYYSIGDGNDIVNDYTENEDKIYVKGTNSVTGTLINSDVIFSIGNNGSIKLLNAKDKEVIIAYSNGTEEKYINGVVSSSQNTDTDTNVVDPTGQTVVLNDNMTSISQSLKFELDEYNKTAITKAVNINASNSSDVWYIYGDDKSNVIISSKCGSSIYAGKGDDEIYFGMYWGTGNERYGGDTLVYHYGDGNDVVHYFNLNGGNRRDNWYQTCTDSIYLADDKAKLSYISFKNDDAILNLTSGNTITLKNAKYKAIRIEGANDNIYNINWNESTWGRVISSDNVENYWFAEDDNFIDNDTNMDSIIKENYAVTNIETSDFNSLNNEFNLTYNQNDDKH